MDIRKKNLWKVPVFCIVAGNLMLYISFYALTYFAIERLPDGTVSILRTREWIIYWLEYLLPLLFGGLVCFRGMTRREIFCSASVVVIYGVVTLVIQGVFQLTTGMAGIWMLYLFRPFQWCTVVAQTVSGIFPSPWPGGVAQVLSVYAFVLFGKKEEGIGYGGK